MRRPKNKLSSVLKYSICSAALSMGLILGAPFLHADIDLSQYAKDGASGYHDYKLNDDGTISIIQNNKVRTSDICAATVAYQATDRTTGKTVTIPISVDTVDNTTNTYNYIDSKTGYEHVIIETKLSAEKSAELKAMMGTYNMQFDHVMAVSTDGGKSYSAGVDNSGNIITNTEWLVDNPYAAAILAASGGDGAFGIGEGLKFAYETFGWADKEGWLTNFQKILAMDASGNILELTEAELATLLKTPTPGDPDDPDNPNTTDTPIPDTPFIIYKTTTGGVSGVSAGDIRYYNDSRNYEEDGSHKGFADYQDSDGNGPGIIIPSSEKYNTWNHILSCFKRRIK